MKHCFFCNNEMNEDSNNSLLAYRLCDQCKTEMGKGNTLIVTSNEPIFENQGCICHLEIPNPEADSKKIPIYPTGEWAVFDDNTIKEFFDESHTNEIIKNKFGLITQEMFDEIKDIYKNIKMKTVELNNEKENGGTKQ